MFLLCLLCPMPSVSLTRAPRGGPNSFNFMQFLGNSTNLYVGAPPGELAPPPRGNPGSTTALCSSYCLFTPNVYISVSVDAHNGYHGFITVIFRKVTLAIALENQVQTHSQLSMLTLTLTLSVNTSAKTPHHS